MAAEDTARGTRPEPSAKADILLGKYHQLSIIMKSRPEYQRNEGKIQYGNFPTTGEFIQSHYESDISPMLKALGSRPLKTDVSRNLVTVTSFCEVPMGSNISKM